MSLNFNYSKCVDSDQLVNPVKHDEMHPVTHFMIWNMMAIDMSVITKENVDEVWFRTKLNMLITDCCAASYNDGNDKPLVRIWPTREDVVRHIGLSTNVSTMTRKKWLEKQFCNPRSIEWLNAPYQEKSAMQMVADRAAEVKAALEPVNE